MLDICVADTVGRDVVFATISGSRLYGTATDDSDFDIRGAFSLTPYELLGIRSHADTIVNHVGGYDVCVHDVGKFVKLLTLGNMNILEETFSPLVITGKDALAELRSLAWRFVTGNVYKSCRGIAINIIRSTKPLTTKQWLNAHRVILAAMYAVREGKIESNLSKLLSAVDGYHYADLVSSELELYLTGSKDVLSKYSLDQSILDQLETLYSSHPLPDGPSGASLRVAHEFVVNLRLGIDKSSKA